MSEILKLEDNANELLKKLSELLDNFSFNLSKEKTEKALSDGYECIKEIENILDRISKITIDNYSQNNLFMIKGDLLQKKEKYEKIRKTYILNKNSQLINSISSTNINEEIDNSNLENSIDTNLEEKINDNNNGQREKRDNNADEIFNIKRDMTELSEEYINSRNILYMAKRRIFKIIGILKAKMKSISAKTKYLVLLIFLIILLIFCFFYLFKEFFEVLN